MSFCIHLDFRKGIYTERGFTLLSENCNFICWRDQKYILLLGSCILITKRKNILTRESKNNRRTNSHDHWYLDCASILFDAQCLTPFYLLSSKPPMVPSVEHRRREASRLHWPPREMDWDYTLKADHCWAVRSLLYAETLYAIHRQPCKAALEKYTLWLRYILRVRLIVMLFVSDVGTREVW